MIAAFDPILELAKKHNIVVLEDAAHAFGAMYKGRMIGTIGDFGAFSMHEVKNITSFGEGGILVSSIPGYAPHMKRARFLGLDFSCPIKDWLYNITAIPGKEHPFIPGNSSTTEIQGLGLSLQVERNEEIIKIRREAAEYLTKRFAENDAIIPQLLDTDDIKPTYHLYLLQIDPAKAGGDVQVLKKKLEEKGVTQIAHFGPLYRFQIVADHLLRAHGRIGARKERIGRDVIGSAALVNEALEARHEIRRHTQHAPVKILHRRRRAFKDHRKDGRTPLAAHHGAVHLVRAVKDHLPLREQDLTSVSMAGDPSAVHVNKLPCIVQIFVGHEFGRQIETVDCLHTIDRKTLFLLTFHNIPH